MEKSIRILSFLSFSTILSAAVVAISGSMAMAQAPAGANALMKAGTEFVVGDRKLDDPLRPFSRLEDPKLAEKATIKETEGCKYLQAWEPSLITENHWHSNSGAYTQRRSQAGIFAIPAKTNCIKVGTPAPVATVDRATGLTTNLGWFMPTAISPRRPAMAKQEESILVSAGLIGSDAEVVMVTGRTMNAAGPMGPGNYAPRIVGARMIDRDQMEAAIKDGTQIIDVRSKKQYDLARVKGAVHVPYTPGPRMKVFDEYSNYVKSGDAFDIRRINSDREKPVILIGENWESDGVYRAAVVLRSEGWKKVFIFYEGMNYFTGMQWSPPLGSVLVGASVNSFQLADLVADKSLGLQIVDVRDAREFALSTIPGAKLATYKERDDLRLRRDRINGKILTDYGDSWAPPAGVVKTNPIVFVGQDLRDWRPYKAALVAKSLGFTKIYWSRPGVEAWMVMAEKAPERFTVVRGTAN